VTSALATLPPLLPEPPPRGTVIPDMAGLAASYRGASRSRAREAGGEEPPDLESVLAELCAQARAAHPEIALEDAAFAAHLARCQAPLSAAPGAAFAGDLFLACAALAGNTAAVAKLRESCGPIVARYLRPLAAPRGFLDELGQELWTALLVGRPDAPPRLAAYSGRGPLAGFVGITAQRIALDGLRHQGAEARAKARGAAESAAVARDAEAGFIKRRYRTQFEQAIRTALDSLENRERMILRMYVVDGLTVDRIAKSYQVSQSTVSRWLAAARARVLADARRILHERLPLSESEFESLVGLMVSQIDLSVSTLLARGRG
jgi:RNA polymerase sigma-70 factor, ECF subfamily